MQSFLPEQHWLALKKGDDQAFEALYSLYSNRLYNYGSKFTDDKNLIKESIQELFINLWNRKRFLGDPISVKNYLFKAFRLSLFKKLVQFQKQVSYNEVEHYHFNAELNVEDTLIAGESKHRLEHRLQITLNELTPRQREAVFLKFYENLTYDEIAEVMDISVKGAYKVVARALEALRGKLSPDDFLLIIFLLSSKFFN